MNLGKWALDNRLGGRNTRQRGDVFPLWLHIRIFLCLGSIIDCYFFCIFCSFSHVLKCAWITTCCKCGASEPPASLLYQIFSLFWILRVVDVLCICSCRFLDLCWNTGLLWLRLNLPPSDPHAWLTITLNLWPSGMLKTLLFHCVGVLSHQYHTRHTCQVQQGPLYSQLWRADIEKNSNKMDSVRI